MLHGTWMLKFQGCFTCITSLRLGGSPHCFWDSQGCVNHASIPLLPSTSCELWDAVCFYKASIVEVVYASEQWLLGSIRCAFVHSWHPWHRLLLLLLSSKKDSLEVSWGELVQQLVSFDVCLCKRKHWLLSSLVPSRKNRRKHPSGNIDHYSWYSLKFSHVQAGIWACQ